MTRVYMDGVFDLFHRGHLEAIKKCKDFGDDIIIGIVSDSDCESYKRKPIINEIDRVEVIKNLKDVKETIFPCPLILTEKFLKDNNIDIVVHGFSDESDLEKQKDFFEVPIKLNKFKTIRYYDKISTTEIINNIKKNY